MLLFAVRSAFAIPWEAIPSGKVRLEYEQRFGTTTSSSKFVTRLDAAAVGFVLDKQLMKYAVDAGASIYTGSSPNISKRSLYRFDLNLTFLNLYSTSAWKLRRLPHPITLWYQRYQDGIATTSGVGGSIHWHLPMFIQLMNEDHFISLSTSSGMKKDMEGEQISGQQEWEQVWNNQQQFQNQGWQGQQGDLEGWDEDLGPTGWGNSSGQWGMEDKEPEKEKKPGRTGPLFSIPFPTMLLSGSLSEREEDNLTNSYDRVNFNLQTHDLHYHFLLDFRRNGISTTHTGQSLVNDTSTAQNFLTLRHEYDGETRKSGNSEREFRMSNIINVQSGETNGSSTPLIYGYVGRPQWIWAFPAQNSDLRVQSSVSLQNAGEVTTYTLSGRTEYDREFSPVLETRSFVGAGYSGTSGAGSSNLVTTAGGGVLWDVSRYVSSDSEVSLQYSSTTGGGGQLGFTGFASFTLKTPVIVASVLDFGYDAVDRRNNLTPENPATGQTGERDFGTVSSMFVQERVTASGRLYKKATWRAVGSYRIEERMSGQTENTARFDLQGNTPITRYASASAGAFYQNFQTDFEEGTSERQRTTLFANLNANPLRGLSAFVRYRFIASSASSEGSSADSTTQNITFSAQYARLFGRILTSITYRTDLRLTDNGTDTTEHRVLVTAERRFGFRPSRY